MHCGLCPMHVEPLIDNTGFSREAHGDEFAPEPGDVATTFGLSPAEIGGIRIDDAWSWSLRPGWSMSLLEPTSDGLTLHADDLRNILMRTALRFQGLGLLKTGLPAGQSCATCVLCDSLRPARSFNVMMQDVAWLGARIHFRRYLFSSSSVAVDNSKKGVRKIAQEMPAV